MIVSSDSSKGKNAFFISGGMMIHETTNQLMNLLIKEGFEVKATEDADDLCNASTMETDLVVLNSCLWTGSGHTLSSRAREAFVQLLELGKGLVVMHSSIGNWDDWHEYIDLVGGVWKWDHSKHSAEDSTFTVEAETLHPVFLGIPPSFEVIDEMYQNLFFAKGNQILARTSSSEGGYPMVWCRKTKNSNVVVITLGHDVRAVTNPVFARLFINACRWTTNITQE